MVHLRPIILALLLAVAGPAAAIPSSAPLSQSSTATTTADNQVYAPANTSSVLTLGEDAEETRAFARQSLDVGTSLAIETDAMEHRFESSSFTAQFEQAETRGDKRDLLIQYATTIDTRTAELESQERNARQGYRNGSVSANQYVNTLILVNAKAKYLQQEIDLALDSANDVNDFTLSGYFSPYEKRLVSLRGPIRENLAMTIRGDKSSGRFYVSAADNGVVLAFLTNGTYEREIFRMDHRSTDGNTRFSSSEMLERAEGFYPWARTDGNSQGLNWQPTNLGGYYSYTFEHPHGEVNGLIDVTTGSVFRESQMKYLTTDAASRNGRESILPKGPGVTANESGLLLTVNRSYAGGPMYVALQDNETGEYVDGTISIDGESVGETTLDGGLWTLSPAGSFNVTATSGFDDVTVETRATRPIQNRNVSQD